MLRLAEERDTVRVVGDQHGAPTYAPDIAAAVLAVLGFGTRSIRKIHNWRGIFNMTAGGGTSWAGFAEEIFRVAGSAGRPTARVEAIATDEYPATARRPANSRLSSARFRQTFRHSLPEWASSRPALS